MSRTLSSTCRLRLSEGEDLSHAERLLPFLHALGISTLSLPSLFRTHHDGRGRRVTLDPTRVDPEVGGEGGMLSLIDALHQCEMDAVLDLSVDRLAATPDNPFFRSLLEEGVQSQFADWFDVDWETSPGGRQRLVLPLLLRPYGEALANGSVKLALQRTGFVVLVHGITLPLCLDSWRHILGRRQGALEAAIGTDHPAIAGLRRLLLRTFEGSIGRHELAARLRQLIDEHEPARLLVDGSVLSYNEAGHSGASLMHSLLEQQNYRLCWRDSVGQLSKTRAVCDGDEGVDVHLEDPEAMTGLHARVFEWIDSGAVRGVTVRDIDHFADPRRYLTTLAERLGTDGDGYIVVEKTLTGEEKVPDEWPIAGTIGREFLNAVARLLVNPVGLSRLCGAYRQFVGPAAPGDGLIASRRAHALRSEYADDVARLVAELVELASVDIVGRDLAQSDLATAVELVTTHLTVSRTYLDERTLRDEDRARIEAAMHRGRAESDGTEPRAFDFLRRVFLEPAEWSDVDRPARTRWVLDWQRLAARVHRQARERPELDLDARLASLNEPGGTPRVAGSALTIGSFHSFNAARIERWPLARNAIATLSDLRGEDIRARLHVLSEQPVRCARAFRRLARITQPLKSRVGRRRAPDANTEWMIYQLLLGVWPFEDDGWAELLPALEEHLRSLLRHVGPRPTDKDPAAFEAGSVRFLRSLFASAVAPFKQELGELARYTQFFGCLNSLSQVVLLVTSPGVPEILECSDGWDLRLCGASYTPTRGPDERQAALAEILEAEGAEGRSTRIGDWLRDMSDARIKTWVLSQALRRRRDDPELFAYGDYIPCEVRGPRAGHVCAFLRRYEGRTALVAVARHMSTLTAPGTLPVGPSVWAGTTLRLPDDAPTSYSDALSGCDFNCTPEVPVGDLLRLMPQALCLGSDG